MHEINRAAVLRQARRMLEPTGEQYGTLEMLATQDAETLWRLLELARAVMEPADVRVWWHGTKDHPGAASALARGAGGLSELEDGLLSRFEGICPQELFAHGGAPEVGTPLLQLLQRFLDRFLRGEGLIDPRGPWRGSVDRPGVRLARAVERWVPGADGDGLLRLAATCLDAHDPDLRLAGLSVAAAHLGRDSVADMVEAAWADESPDIRLAAVKILERRSGVMEIARRAISFCEDLEPEVRAVAVRAVARSGDEDMLGAVAAMTLDPHPQVAAAARQALPEGAAGRFLRDLARRLAVGGSASLGEMGRFLRAEELSLSAREDAMAARLFHLAVERGDGSEIADALRALAGLPEEPSPRLWRAARRAALQAPEESVRALIPVVGRGVTHAAGLTALAVLSRPLGGPSLRLALAEAARGSLRASPSLRRFWIGAIAQESRPDRVRSDLLWALTETVSSVEAETTVAAAVETAGPELRRGLLELATRLSDGRTRRSLIRSMTGIGLVEEEAKLLKRRPSGAGG